MRNKTIKRMLALALVAVMSLTACGQKANSNAGTSETKTESKVESAGTSEPAGLCDGCEVFVFDVES